MTYSLTSGMTGDTILLGRSLSLSSTDGDAVPISKALSDDERAKTINFYDYQPMAAFTTTVDETLTGITDAVEIAVNTSATMQPAFQYPTLQKRLVR